MLFIISVKCLNQNGFKSIKETVDRVRVFWTSNIEYFGVSSAGGDYWTGGLNPGLLWIWPQSAQQIVTNGTSSDNSTALGAQGGIPGAGRCLAWLREGAGAGAGAGGAGGAAGWGYRGQDCGRALRYVCEAAPDRELLTNDILRAARLLRGPRV